MINSMKKIFSLLAIMLMTCVSLMAQETLTNKFERCCRKDKVSFDVSFNTSGYYGGKDYFSSTEGFSVGMSFLHFYLDGGFSWADDKDNTAYWNIHVGGNLIMEDALGHNFIITPCVGLFSPLESNKNYGGVNALDYGVVWRYNHNNSPLGLTFKTFAQSGVSLGITINFE